MKKISHTLNMSIDIYSGQTDESKMPHNVVVLPVIGPQDEWGRKTPVPEQDPDGEDAMSWQQDYP